MWLNICALLSDGLIVLMYMPSELLSILSRFNNDKNSISSALLNVQQADPLILDHTTNVTGE